MVKYLLKILQTNVFSLSLSLSPAPPLSPSLSLSADWMGNLKITIRP